TVTSRNSEKITLAYNDTDKTYIVSSSYIVFEVDKKNILLPEYLFMFFNRPEFDRLARFNSWGSARETFTWEDMCDLKIIIPPIDVQRKYVSLYKALLNNQQTYETGLNDLKLLCDMYIEQLQKTEKAVEIGKYIEPFDERNTVGLTKYDVRGISTSKEIIPTKAKLEGVKLDNYKLYYPNQIAFVPDTSRRGEKISLALNNSENTYLVSSITTIFSTDPN